MWKKNKQPQTHPKLYSKRQGHEESKEVRKHETCVSDGRNHSRGDRKGHPEGKSGFPSEHQ